MPGMSETEIPVNSLRIIAIPRRSSRAIITWSIREARVLTEMAIRVKSRHRGFGMIDMAFAIIVGVSTMAAGVSLFGQMTANSSAQSILTNSINLHQQVQAAVRRGDRFSTFPGFEDDVDRILAIEAMSAEDLETQGLTVRAPLSGPDNLRIFLARPPSGNCLRLARRIQTLGSGMTVVSCGAPGGPLILEFRNAAN